MNHLKKQQGLSLVELLATITILSIVLTITISLLLDGMSVSNKISSTSQLQQQGNYLLLALEKQHEKGEPYKIRVDADGKTIQLVTVDRVNPAQILETNIIENQQFRYELYKDQGTEKITDLLINPLKEDKHFTVNIKVLDAQNNDRSYEIQTTLSRL